MALRAVQGLKEDDSSAVLTDFRTDNVYPWLQMLILI